MLNCYILILDCNKAFDKVKHSKVFNISTEKNICPLYIRVIINMYEHSKSRIKWNNVKSDNFYIGNGVKQGGVLSPILFNLYLDPLLKIEGNIMSDIISVMYVVIILHMLMT